MNVNSHGPHLQTVELGLHDGPVTPVDGSLAPRLLDVGPRVPGPVAGQQARHDQLQNVSLVRRRRSRYSPEH